MASDSLGVLSSCFHVYSVWRCWEGGGEGGGGENLGSSRKKEVWFYLTSSIPWFGRVQIMGESHIALLVIIDISFYVCYCHFMQKYFHVVGFKWAVSSFC